MKKFLFVSLFCVMACVPFWGQTSSVFYGQQIVLTGDPNVNRPSDYTTVTQPPVGNGVSINNNRPSNAKLDTSWGTPVWRCNSAKNVANTSWAWSVPVDDKHRWCFITTTGSDTTGYVSKQVVNLWDGSLACSVGYMQLGGPGHRDTIRDPYTGTLFVTNSVVTIVTSAPAFPLDKSLAGTDLIINGTKYVVATDDSTNGITLQQTGVNIGSAGSPISFMAGWNDQDVVYGLYPPSQIARVNIRVCNAVAPSKVTSPTDASWQTYDTINGGSGYSGTNLFYNGYLCGGSSDISDDGNTFCISDNTNSTGNTYDPRLYTLNTKNGGTWSAAIPRYAWNTLTALNCASGGTTCTITTTGSPDYQLGAQLQIENANITGGGPGARSLKYMTCYVSVVTDVNHYTVNGCPTQTTTVAETSGYVNQALRSAMTVEQADNFPTIGAGIGKTYLQGTENNSHNGGSTPIYEWDVSTATPTLAKLLTMDNGHITRFAYNGDIYLLQYAGKTVHTASGDQTMAGCSNSMFMWNSRTDAMTCLFPNGMDLSEEYYSTATPARRGNPHPYLLISQTDDYPTALSALTGYTFATKPASGNFKLTDAAVAGDCGAGGGTQIAFCGYNAGLAAYVPFNTFSIPLMTGTVSSNNWDWTQRWGYNVSGSNYQGITRYITNEVFLYDLVGGVGYHMMHHYTRSVAYTYANQNPFNELPHVTCSRDGIICGVDSSYGTGQDVGGYMYQVLRDASGSASSLQTNFGVQCNVSVLVQSLGFSSIKVCRIGN